MFDFDNDFFELTFRVADFEEVFEFSQWSYEVVSEFLCKIQRWVFEVEQTTELFLNGIDFSWRGALVDVKELEFLFQLIQCLCLAIFHEHLSGIGPVKGRDSLVVFIEFFFFVLYLSVILIKNVRTVDVVFLDKVDDFTKMTVDECKLFILF